MRALRAILTIALVVFVAFLLFGWWTGYRPISPNTEVRGTSGTIDTAKARERGAEVGEKAAEAAASIKETVSEAALTSKIKAKMALDDYVRARAIDVTTNGTTVTLSGTVRSVDEHDRAVKLARETAGVSQVADRIVVRP